MEWFERAKMMVVKFTDIAVALLALAIILQLLFGSNTQFLGDVAGNIITFLKAFGGQGLVAIGVVLYILTRN
ncbi:MAG: hypothetical protein Q8K93_14520 [Reyranella sp.]|nr:hypothetical protein [Reyranella sp.]